MNTSTKDIQKEVEACRAAEAELAKLRLEKQQAERDLASAENSEAADRAGNIDAVLEKLRTRRERIKELDYEIGVRERNLANRHAMLRNHGVSLLDSARRRLSVTREKVMCEVRRRIAPFVGPKQIRTTILEADVLPLRRPSKLYGSISGLLERLRDTPADGCALILDKYEALIAECTNVEKSLGI